MSLIVETKDIPVSKLIIDDDKNVRKNAGLQESNIDAFAARLAAEGQITPITVQKRPGGRYFVTAGYRRSKAAKINQWKTIRAEILDPSLTEEQIQILNHLENLDREPLSDYDMAAGALEMGKAQKMSLKEYSMRTNLSFITIQQLTQWVRTLPKSIVNSWRDGHPLLTRQNLALLASLTQEAAIEKWDQMKNWTESGPPDGVGSGRSSNPMNRPPLKKLIALRERIEESTVPEPYKKLIAETIEYAQGAKRQPPKYPKAKSKGAN